MKRIWIYDTTLRDGKQAENVNLSLTDMLAIAKRLDQFGVDYLECGWPAANPKDRSFFEEIKKVELHHAQIAAFGSTRHAKNKVQEDPNIEALLKADTPVVTIFGKSWDLHVREVFHISLEENLKLVYESIDYLKRHNKQVFFDAEHFFDGYRSNPEYALKVLETAEKAGADAIILADTNGGMLPSMIREIMSVVTKEVKTHIGIHAHNDSDCAVANSLEAVLAGAVQVQGTFNGVGERCGNANLVSIIPNLVLKLGYDCGAITLERLKQLTEVSHYIYEIANLSPDNKQPYTGHSAFAHKGGVHVNAVEKNPKTYEHIDPEMVGNRRRILISEQSGKSNILEKAHELGLEIKDAFIQPLLHKVKEMENMGYEFEGADASFELLVKRITGNFVERFDIISFRVSSFVKTNDYSYVEATVKLRVGEMEELTVGEGDGPVNALDIALKKGLSVFYPVIKAVKLTDYKVRILNPKAGTAAVTRVLVSFQYNGYEWQTVGVSSNIIEASWQALVDSMHYILMKVEK
ncbi:citramalate synthase [Thermospira aquatica]|uniref:Citramalate synthase n=1 Tax=Thermospira aquatica TaxID=2828656 RepID=A0AAX3BAD8_9SPIR|nr:citramalate synthase [Thermospira aquatica]URA09184.1 citramalate synthase [Thermospira aquatica]